MAREIETIHKEYANALYSAGEKSYLIFLKNEEIKKLEYEQEKLLNQARSLAHEVDAINQSKKLEKEVAAANEAV